MTEKKRRIVRLLGAGLILLGVLGMLYPVVGSYINSLRFRNVVTEYRSEVRRLDDTRVREMLQAAEEYNRRLFQRSEAISLLTEEQLEEYRSLLQVSGTGSMGYLEIPKLDLSLPVYHGTEENVLQVGIGHLEGSSLPVGGESTHTVLTGHAGLPSAELFTNLDQLDIGDSFTITVLDRTLRYTVDDITVILPEEADLRIGEGEDTCTLVTCTPIGANTHRLLVHATRSEEA